MGSAVPWRFWAFLLAFFRSQPIHYLLTAKISRSSTYALTEMLLADRWLKRTAKYAVSRHTAALHLVR